MERFLLELSCWWWQNIWNEISQNTRNFAVGIPTALWGKQCMHCWSPQCILYAELWAYMHFEGEDYRRACCLLKTTCWLQHITQRDVRMLVYGTDAWFRAAPQDSPHMRSEGQRTGDLGYNQGFWVAEMQTGFHVGVCFNHLTIFATWVLNDCSLWIFMMWSEAAAMHKACWGIFR